MRSSRQQAERQSPADPHSIRGWLASPEKFVWHYLKERRVEFVWLLVCVNVAAACSVLMQYQMKEIIDAMTVPDHAVRAVGLAMGILIALMATESALLRASSWLTCRASIGAGVQMRLDIFNYLAGHSLGYFTDNLSGALGQRVTGTAGNFGALVNTAAWRILPPVVDYIGALVIFSLIALPMAIVLSVSVAAATLLLVLAGRRGRHLHTAYSALASKVAGNLMDVISNMWAVKAFTARQREALRLRTGFGEEAAAQHTSWMYTERTRIFYDLAVWAIAAGMSFWAVRAWARHAITPGDVVVITALTFRILHGSRDVALALVDVSLQFGYIDDTLQTIGRMHTLVDATAAAETIAGPCRISFDDVTFGYRADDPVLRNIDIVIHPGEKVGIVGASGAGKSTIVQLIQRLHAPQSGQITIDGRPIESYTQDALRNQLAVVPQEIGLFHRSIIENIRFGRPDASNQEVFAAAAAAQCDDFVRLLPEGYATIVGERGVRLSGGQRQRVGIARAFLRNGSVLILDEATSALDTTSELQIQETISRSLRGRTVIAVAHRLSTLSSYDRIIVIDQGRVVEDGTPLELRRRGTFFRAMWRLQANGMRVEETPSVRRRRANVQ